MAWRNFGRTLAITRRRRTVASALVYGLSLTVRFTSATGEEIEAPAPALGANPMASVMIYDGAQVPYKARPSQPAAFLDGASQPGCRAACESAMPALFMPDCAARP